MSINPGHAKDGTSRDVSHLLTRTRRGASVSRHPETSERHRERLSLRARRSAKKRLHDRFLVAKSMSHHQREGYHRARCPNERDLAFFATEKDV